MTEQSTPASEKIRVSIVGASGYTGGEVLRLLLSHPCVEIGQVTSESSAGNYVYSIHPNLRKGTQLQFVSATALQPADVVLVALPHGELQKRIDAYSKRARYIVDLSADFRLRDTALYQRYYEEVHSAPGWLDQFIYGLPEINCEALRTTRYASGVGCNATASILALLPLVRAGLIDPSRPITVDLKVGSSESGATASQSSHHPERSGAVRTFAATGHRHEAEVAQALGVNNVYLSITSVEMIRGVMATAQLFVKPGTEEKSLWKAFRGVYNAEPFVRIVHEKTGLHRHPEPKWLSGTNYADVGWGLEPETGRPAATAAMQ